MRHHLAHEAAFGAALEPARTGLPLPRPLGKDGFDLDPLELSDLARGEVARQSLDRRRGSEGKIDRGFVAFALDAGDHRGALAEIHRQRLFREYRLAPVEGASGMGEVACRRRGDVDAGDTPIR